MADITYGAIEAQKCLVSYPKTLTSSRTFIRTLCSFIVQDSMYSLRKQLYQNFQVQKNGIKFKSTNYEKHQKLETILCPSTEWIDKIWYSQTQPSLNYSAIKKNLLLILCCSGDEPQKHYKEKKSPDTIDDILNDSIYTKCPVKAKL